MRKKETDEEGKGNRRCRDQLAQRFGLPQLFLTPVGCIKTTKTS